MASFYGQNAVTYFGATPRLKSQISNKQQLLQQQPPQPPPRQQHPEIRGRRSSRSGASQPPPLRPKPTTRLQTSYSITKPKQQKTSSASYLGGIHQHQKQQRLHTADVMGASSAAVPASIRCKLPEKGELMDISQLTPPCDDWNNAINNSQSSQRSDPTKMAPPMSQASSTSASSSSLSSGYLTAFQQYQVKKLQQEANPQSLPPPQQQRRIDGNLHRPILPQPQQLQPTNFSIRNIPFKHYLHINPCEGMPSYHMPPPPPPLRSTNSVRPAPPHRRVEHTPLISSVSSPITAPNQHLSQGSDMQHSRDDEASSASPLYLPSGGGGDGSNFGAAAAAAVAASARESSQTTVSQVSLGASSTTGDADSASSEQSGAMTEAQWTALIQESFTKMKNEYETERQAAMDEFALHVQNVHNELNTKAEQATSQWDKMVVQIADANQQWDVKTQHATSQWEEQVGQASRQLDKTAHNATLQMEEKSQQCLAQTAAAEAKHEAATKQLDQKMGLCASMADEGRKFYGEGRRFYDDFRMLYDKVMGQMTSYFKYGNTCGAAASTTELGEAAVLATPKKAPSVSPAATSTPVVRDTVPPAVAEHAASRGSTKTAKLPAKSQSLKPTLPRGKVETAAKRTSSPKATKFSLSPDDGKCQLRRTSRSKQKDATIAAPVKPIHETAFATSDGSSQSQAKSILGPTQGAPKTNTKRQHGDKTFTSSKKNATTKGGSRPSTAKAVVAASSLSQRSFVTSCQKGGAALVTRIPSTTNAATSKTKRRANGNAVVVANATQQPPQKRRRKLVLPSQSNVFQDDYEGFPP